MRYHIYHVYTPLVPFLGKEVSFLTRHDWGVDEEFVRKIVKAYLRGEREIVISRKTYLVGTKSLHIYEAKKHTGTSGLLIDILNQASAQNKYSKEYFKKTFKDVTEKFLLGRKWGDLKEDYYNIYINDGASKPVILSLTKPEVDSFLDDWAIGKKQIWVSAERFDFNDPKSIKIFGIDFQWLSKDRGEIRYQIKKYANGVHNGKYTIEVLENFGKEVTHSWEIKPYGRSKPKTINFNWDLIHPEIVRVAKGRFQPPHYADAVEAAFKEINDIIRKEFHKVASNEDDGVSLMRQVFKPSNPIFKLTDLKTETDKNIQDGYMQIFAGSMSAIRNPKAHANLEIDEQDAWEKIVLASHLMKMWDKRIV